MNTQASKHTNLQTSEHRRDGTFGLGRRGAVTFLPEKVRNTRIREFWNRDAKALKLHEKHKRSQFSYLMKLLYSKTSY